MVKNALKITIENKELSLKILSYKVIIFLFTFILMFLLVYLPFKDVVSLLLQDLKDIIIALKAKLYEFFVGGEYLIEGCTVKEYIGVSIDNLYSLLYTRPLIMSLVFIVFSLILCLQFFLISLYDYAAGINLEEYMTKLHKTNLNINVIDNFKDSVFYAIFITIYDFIYFVIMLIVFVISLKLLINHAFYFFILMILLIVILTTFFQIVSYCILPIMIMEKLKIKDALKRNFIISNYGVFKKRFISYFIANVSSIALFVLFTFTTFGIGLLVCVPLLFEFYLTLRFTDYFEQQNIKYFITKNTIVSPIDDDTLV